MLEELVDELEPKDFGREPIEERDLDRLEALCDRWLGASPRGRGRAA